METPQHVGDLIRRCREAMGFTQKELALTSGTGIRFIVELEKGKETCQLGKVLDVLNTLGITLSLLPPWTDEPLPPPAPGLES